MTSFKTINPATDRKIVRYELLTVRVAMAIDKKVRDAHQSRWNKLAIAKRTDYLESLAKSPPL